MLETGRMDVKSRRPASRRHAARARACGDIDLGDGLASSALRTAPPATRASPPAPHWRAKHGAAAPGAFEPACAASEGSHHGARYMQ